jgi:hypothetical protein
MKEILLKITTISMVFAILMIAVPGAGDDQVIYGCVANKAGTLRIVSATTVCKSSETPISWSKVSGISKVVHGVVDQGVKLAGTGFTSNLGNDGITAIYFTPEFTEPPTCVATATPSGTAGEPDCDINVLGSPGAPETKSNIAVGCLEAGVLTGGPSAFRFICVQSPLPDLLSAGDVSIAAKKLTCTACHAPHPGMKKNKDCKACHGGH